MSVAPKLRVARPTDNLDELVRFYRDGLGLEILFRFENHEGFDGVMLGRSGAPITLSSRTPTDILPGMPRPKTIFWSFIFPTEKNGKPPSNRCETQVSNRYPRSIRTGTATVLPSKTPTAIASSSRMRPGIDRIVQ
jgi:hypothetical protein